MTHANTMRRRSILAAGLALLLSGGAAGAADNEIVLGATVPLTGPLVFSAGGINGKKLRIVFEDTQASNSVAVNAFIKLLRQENPPFIFLSSFTTQNLAVEAEVAKAKIPVMYAGGSEAVTDRKNPWMFRLRPDDSLLALALSKAALGKFGKKPTGVMYVQDDYGLGAANTVEALLNAAGSSVVGKEAFGPRDNDFSAQLLNLKNKGAQLYVVIGYVRDTALILQQRRNLGITADFVTGQGTAMPSTLDLMTPPDVNGIVATIDAVLGEPVGPASVTYMKRFEERFKVKADPFGSAYYDGAMIVAEALRKVGPDREKIRDYLAGLKDFKGVTRVFGADEKGNLAHSAAIINFVPGTKDFTLQEYVTK
jgi:branched-chain amino acid transport system substrate-binding protein